MAASLSSNLIDALHGGLLEPSALEQLPGLQDACRGAEDLAGELVRRGWLTGYQATTLLQGQSRDLVRGSYVLLERLGEGGMGTVFKARHRRLGKVVALKVIRPERLGSPTAVRRFWREVRAVAQLDYPHIVHAYDADEIGGTHFLVMEYVAGQDLARLVESRGPLPVDLACDCARQAALGLQHAHERGMVHRDVKPQNLMLAPSGMVKILDMGLARFGQAADASQSSSHLTKDEVLMGTPDYMAPEQAVDAHTADGRADVYSLGCTFYFLLTGRVPFPGSTALKKMFKHCWVEPEPVEHLRADVGPAVAVVVRKLMAKRPESRYQTPAEAAATLLALFPAAEIVPEPPTGPGVDDWMDAWSAEVAAALVRLERRADGAQPKPTGAV
jgi:eukaryotic-like serine/threonine-protein kinase